MASRKVKLNPYRVWLHFHDSPMAFEKASGCKLDDFVGGAVSKPVRGHMHMYLPIEDGSVSMPDLAHESFHVADSIFDYTGVDLQYNTGNEHMAYLIGFVVESVLDMVYSITKGNK